MTKRNRIGIDSKWKEKNKIVRNLNLIKTERKLQKRIQIDGKKQKIIEKVYKKGTDRKSEEYLKGRQIKRSIINKIKKNNGKLIEN